MKLKLQITMGLIFVILISSLNLIIIAEDSEYQTEKQDLLITHPYFIKKIVHAKDQKYSDFNQEQYKPDISFINLEKDVLISADNPDGDDIHPKIIRKDNTLVMTYEKSINHSSKTNPIVWSQNYGQTWTTQFELDSSIIPETSGIMQRPDIKYVPGIDQFYFSAVDPEAYMYNNVMFWIPGNITTAEEALAYAISGPQNYYDSATGATENWGIAVTTVDAYEFNKTFSLGYFTYPDFEKPPVMGGYYYDCNRVHNSSPADKLEMGMNDNRIFLVSEQTEKGKISIKSTVNNEALLNNGEVQNGFDKYADIENWPGEYIANGSDPDISACEDKVFVVYLENDTIKCKYSTSSYGYEPYFDWNESTIDKDNVYCPTVYAYSTKKIICAYVKDNNLFVAKSYDGALTWGEPYQINDIDGTVVETSGSVAISDMGVVWTDNREGQSDIYFQLNNEDFFIPIITFTGGLGITIEIENIGDISVENIDISISIDAPFIIIGKEKIINVSIDKYESITYRMFTLGFGKMTITVDCGMFGSESASGILYGPFVWIT